MSRKKKKPVADAEIHAVWDQIEAEDPDISDAKLFARICSHFNHRVDNGDIANAMLSHPDVTVHED